MNYIIKELRLKRGFTLEQVGDYVGVGKSTVRKWENGMIENMRRDKIAKLAEILGTTPDYLIADELGTSLDYMVGLSQVDSKTMEFINLFSQLKAEQQDMVIASMKGILNNK